MHSIYDIELTTIEGQPTSLAAYRGQVLLVVNVASQCGFTGQYAALEDLYRRYRDQGFVVLAFPCNQFLRQEPGDAAQIKTFCSSVYDVTFPLFAKTAVNGPQAHPLYQVLTRARRGFLGSPWIKWNFTKFLVDRSGNVVRRYAPTAQAARIERDLAPLLG
jgi:glutathione peroxidase